MSDMRNRVINQLQRERGYNEEEAAFLADALLPLVRQLCVETAATELRLFATYAEKESDKHVNAIIAGRVDEHLRGVAYGLDWAADESSDRARTIVNDKAIV
jgi:hypothetical protein